MCVSFLALILYTLVNMTVNSPAQRSSTLARSDVELVLGYVLIILGYLLVPGVGVLLVRRQRCMARNQFVLQLDSDVFDNRHFSALFGDALSCSLMRRFTPSDTSAICRQLEQCTTKQLWHAHPADHPAQCAICLSDLQPGCHARILACKHAFHAQCAHLWIVRARKNSCPLCWTPVCEGRGLDMKPC